METEGGRTDHSLESSLFERGYEFEFFQAVRLLLRLFPDRAPVGQNFPPAREVVRFRSRQSLAFPPSTVHELTRPDNDKAPNMTVAFLGLTGPQGTLPMSYTEEIIARNAKHDTASGAFLDIFNHRFIGLFYQAWEKYHFTIAYERQKTSPPAEQEGLTTYLYDLIGMGTKGLQDRLHIPDQALLLYAGLIAQRPHSASALAGILRDYFRVDVEIEQFHGKWFQLTEDVMSYLSPEGAHNELGFGTVAGDAIWNPQARFRVCVGPLTYGRFRSFLPGGRTLAALKELVQYFIGPALEFDIQLTLMAKEVPPCVAKDEGDRAPMLGLSSWLDRESITYDADEVILEGTRKAA